MKRDFQELFGKTLSYSDLFQCCSVVLVEQKLEVKKQIIQENIKNEILKTTIRVVQRVLNLTGKHLGNLKTREDEVELLKLLVDKCEQILK